MSLTVLQWLSLLFGAFPLLGLAGLVAKRRSGRWDIGLRSLSLPLSVLILTLFWRPVPLIVDNATGSDASIAVNGGEAIAVRAGTHQSTLVFARGHKYFKARNTDGEEETSSVFLPPSLFGPDAIIYNVRAKNSYRIKRGDYRQKD